MHADGRRRERKRGLARAAAACAAVAAALAIAATIACDGHRDGGSSTAADSLAGHGAGGGPVIPMSPEDSVRSRTMGYWLAAKTYLDGWQATGSSLARASGVEDTTRDADVASAFVLGKATEQHLFDAFEAAAATSPHPPIDAKVRALHTARRNTLEHYQAFLSDGTAEELELATEGYKAEVAIATPLGEELRVEMAKLSP